MSTQIRMAGRNDTPYIVSLLNRTFRTPTDEGTWEWYVRGNPFGETRVYLAGGNGSDAVAGVFAYTPVPLRIGGAPIPASSGHHLCVDAGSRGGPVFLAMSRAALRGEAEAGVALGLGVPNKRSHEPQKKLVGWSDLMVLDRLRKVRPAGCEHHCIRVERFDNSFDAFYGGVTRGFAFCIEKNAAWMNWRFFERPNSPYVAFASTDGSKLNGYAVLKRWTEPDGYTKANIVDFHAAGDAEAVQLLAAAQRYAEGCGEIDLWAAPDYPYRECLRQAGFSPVEGAAQPVIAKALDGRNIELPAGPASLSYADADFVY